MEKVRQFLSFLIFLEIAFFLGRHMTGSVIVKLRSILTQPVEDAGYEILDMEIVQEGDDQILRVLVDHPQGITLDECVKVNSVIEEILEGNDPMQGSYRLEISSPGAFRPLLRQEHFVRFMGERGSLRLNDKAKGSMKVSAELLGCNEDGIHYRDESTGLNQHANFQDVMKANLDPILKF